MSTRMPDTHSEAWALLPWLANGRLPAEDREWVEAHVNGCADCRAELESQRTVAAQMHRDGAASSPATASDEQRSFNKLWSRIEAAEAISDSATQEPISGTGVRARSSRTVRWLAAAVVVQALGLGVLGMSVLGSQPAGGDFTLVTRPEARLNAPAVRIVFTPETSILTMNTVLTHQGLKIVDGPGNAGNYTAVLSADAVASGATADSVAQVIAKDPHVAFAQPVAR